MWCFKNCFELFWRLLWRLCWNFSHAWSRGMPLRHPAGGLRASDLWPLVATREHENNWKTRHHALKNIFALLHFNTWKKCQKKMLTQLILEQLMDVLLCSARDSPFHSSCWQYPLTYISCIQPIFPQCVEQRVEQCETNLGPSRDISGLGHIEVPGCFPWRRRFPSRHITAGPSRPVTALRAARLPHCTAQRPRHRCLFYHAICQPYTLENVFAKHPKITKICPLTSFDMFRDRTLMDISFH